MRLISNDELVIVAGGCLNSDSASMTVGEFFGDGGDPYSGEPEPYEAPEDGRQQAESSPSAPGAAAPGSAEAGIRAAWNAANAVTSFLNPALVAPLVIRTLPLFLPLFKSSPSGAGGQKNSVNGGPGIIVTGNNSGGQSIQVFNCNTPGSCVIQQK
jgi:hypothetical protein